jgi:hypothetical protein
MRIYKNDILYSQGDNADDSKCLNFKILVYFILKGSIVLHVDLNDPNINPDLNKTANNIKRRQTSVGVNQDTQQ